MKTAVKYLRQFFFGKFKGGLEKNIYKYFAEK